MIVRFKGKDGAEREVEIQKRADGNGFICPCCGELAGYRTCPCGAMVPPNYSSCCGIFMAVAACPSCGQPMPASPAVQEAVSEMTETMAEEGRSEVCSDGFVSQCRKDEKEWIVAGYASLEVPDSKGTRLSARGVVAKARNATIDIEHSCKPIPGTRIAQLREVRKRLPDHGLVSAAYIEVAHDPNVPEARAAYEAAERGEKAAFSTYFFIPLALDRQAKAAAARGEFVDVREEDIHSMPHISYVSVPSCKPALVDCMRSAAEEPETPPAEPPATTPESTPETPAPALEAAAPAFDTLAASARTEPTPAIEVQPPDAPAPENSQAVQQLRSELTAQTETLVEQARRQVLSDVSAFLQEKVAPAVDAVLTAARKGDDATLAACRRYFDGELAKLRLAEPTHEPAQPDRHTAVMRADEEKPAVTDFGKIPAGRFSR